MSTTTKDASSLPLLIAVLDRYREPLFVIDEGRRILFRNAAGARVVKGRGGLCERHGRLSLGAASADERLRSVLLDDGPRRRHARGIRVLRPKAHAEWLLLIHPLTTGGSDPAGRTPLFFVQALGRLAARDGQLLALADLFGLTVREISVARELLRTGSITATATSLSLSVETIRTYLKRIFRKCDVHNKGELLTILLWLAEFPGGG